MGKRISFQQLIKRSVGKCQICEEDNYDLLDVHRIIPGSEGGKYKENNVVCLCCKCHRKVHSGDIVIDRKYFSTGGFVLHYFENNQEFWKWS